LFVDIPEFFDRDELYQVKGVDYPDNFERFAAFSMAVCELMPRLNFIPDIVHLQDWHTALVAPLLRTKFQGKGMDSAKIIQTIHNLSFQGIFPKTKFDLLGLPESDFVGKNFEFWGDVNLLKSGIMNSDFITTVSPRYAVEIQSMEYGFGLEGVLHSRANRLVGILNGIDTEEWNPAVDREIIRNYKADDLRPKILCKSFLQDEVNLGVDIHAPILGFIGRLTDQKGFDLVAEIVADLAKDGFQIVVLGTGDPKYHRVLEDLKNSYPKNLSYSFAFDNHLAHVIYAGADMFLMPSKFEPCGLGQMISLAYGTIPIVRETGGLADTVTDADADKSNGNGFVFNDYTDSALYDAIARAKNAYADSDRWRELLNRAVKLDFSWNKSAQKYIELYSRALTM
jgi:starch synthase